jgi:hypothetical protein
MSDERTEFFRELAEAWHDLTPQQQERHLIAMARVTTGERFRTIDSPLPGCEISSQKLPSDTSLPPQRFPADKE